MPILLAETYEELAADGLLWTPAMVQPELLRWHAADRLDSLTFGTGAQVATWRSAMPLRTTAAFTQGTASNRGDWGATSFAGRPGITLAGTDNYTSDATVTPGNRYEAIIACTMGSGTANSGRLLGGWNNNDDWNDADACAFLTRQGTNQAVWCTQDKLGVGNDYGPVSITYDRPHILRCSATSAAIRMIVDGLQATSGSNGATLAAVTMGIGRYNNSDVAAWHGVVAEIVVLAGTSANLIADYVEGYLAHKYGIALAAGHRFASHPPLIGA